MGRDKTRKKTWSGLTKRERHIRIELKLFKEIGTSGKFGPNWTQIPQVVGWDTQKVFLNLQLYICIRMRSYG